MKKFEDYLEDKDVFPNEKGRYDISKYGLAFYFSSMKEMLNDLAEEIEQLKSNQ